MTEDFIQENEDRELFRRIKQGSEEAFRVVYGKYHRILYAVALKMLKDRSAAENAVQHVFVKLWIGRQEMTVMLSLRNYLYTMTRNYILNYLRSRNTELVHSYRLAQLIPEASDPLDAQIEREGSFADARYGDRGASDPEAAGHVPAQGGLFESRDRRNAQSFGQHRPFALPGGRQTPEEPFRPYRPAYLHPANFIFMNRPSEELLHKTLENRATAAEATSVAEWLATDSGQAWASRYIGRDFDRQESCGDYEREEVASERIFARIKTALTRSRRRRILFRVAAVVIPVALVLGVALRLDRQVGGIFSDAEYGEFVVDRGRRTQCLFQDGTVAHLNSESKIHYPVKFGLFERRIRLEGEAYFEVTHNPRRPFVVEFEGGEIQVLGTSFNVKAYRDDDIVAVTLDEGRVVLDDRRGGRFELSPSEQLLYDRRSGEGRIVRGADAMRYSIWKDDVISFRDTPLAEVLETLSRWYDVRFETDGQPDRPISYTFATDNTLLDNVLREMELISPVRFERTKTEIKVSFR